MKQERWYLGKFMERVKLNAMTETDEELLCGTDLENMIRMRENQIREETTYKIILERRVAKTEKQIKFYEQTLETLKDKLKEEKLQVINSANLISTWKKHLEELKDIPCLQK